MSLNAKYDPYGTDKDIWYLNEPNPDYKLAVINSSNKGFMSQMRSKSGSYLIEKFTEKMMDNVCSKGNKYFLFQVVHEIQQELHDSNIQLIEAKYNNKLEYIKMDKKEID